jgi:hypothetical protein
MRKADLKCERLKHVQPTFNFQRSTLNVELPLTRTWARAGTLSLMFIRASLPRREGPNPSARGAGRLIGEIRFFGFKNPGFLPESGGESVGVGPLRPN